MNKLQHNFLIHVYYVPLKKTSQSHWRVNCAGVLSWRTNLIEQRNANSLRYPYQVYIMSNSIYTKMTTQNSRAIIENLHIKYLENRLSIYCKNVLI